MQSVSFDRAAHIYDETRGFPPGIGDLVAEAALDFLPRHARVLEVGIGTGRIAKPLLARGAEVWGIDLAPKMMARLLETLPPGAKPPPLTLADAASLPFRTESFDAALSVHVFHLIADWRTAAREVRRMLRPGGVFLIGYDWRETDSPGERLRDRWRAIIAGRGVSNQPGAHDFSDVDAFLRADGVEMQERAVGQWTTTRTLAQHIETIEHRTWSSSWDVPEHFFAECLAELRAWAQNEFGSLEREFTVAHKFVWQCYRWSQPMENGRADKNG